MSTREKTITEFMIEEQRRFPEATGDFTALLNYVRLACKRISFIVGRGALAGAHGSAQATNVQGETQQKLDVISNDIFCTTSEYGGHLAGMLSEELDEPYQIPSEYPRGKYLLAFDPLDGSSNIDINAPVGSIFSVLRAPRGTEVPRAEDFLQPGSKQLCGGYAIYGATTMLVLSVGRGVHGFTLDRGFGEFILTHPNMRIAEETNEFAINASNDRFWEPPVKRYVVECLRAAAVCAARISTCDGSRPWSEKCIAYSYAADYSCIRRTPRIRASRDGCDCCTRQILWRCSSSRPAAAYRRGACGCSISSQLRCTSACR